MEVRPSHEVQPMGAADVAEMKVHEHVIAAAEKERRVQAKREELQELRRQVGEGAPSALGFTSWTALHSLQAISRHHHRYAVSAGASITPEGFEGALLLPSHASPQAESLDVEAQGLFAEASQEKQRMDQVQERVGKYEQVGSSAPSSVSCGSKRQLSSIFCLLRL